MGFLSIILILTSFAAFGTSFQKVGVETQIKEADGIVIGHYLKSKSVMLENGKVATQMVFQLKKEFGLQSEFYGINEVIVHFPGGTYQGLTTLVHGVPKFVVGEQIALLTKSIDNRYWGLNLGYGTFKVINYGKDIILVNSLFPEDPKVGQVRLEDFEKTVRAIKGENLKVVKNTQYIPSIDNQRTPASVIQGKNRTIASKNVHEDNRGESSSLNIFWLVGFLAFIGGVFRMIRQNQSH